MNNAPVGDGGEIADLETRADTPGSSAEPAERRPTRRGRQIGRYLVLEQIGHGGMGRVLRAYDPKLDREVALKLLHHDAMKDTRGNALGSDAQDHLVAEARAMAKLSDPHVVAIYDVEQTSVGLVLVMEYVRGHTLRAWLCQATHPWPDVLNRFVEAGRGLAAAHAEDLLHRDFKPSNVLIPQQGPAKVTDFGLAKLTPSTDSDSPRNTSVPTTLGAPATRDGEVAGTPRYMAPEQHRGEALSPAVDQYAFCVALWEAMTGNSPFTASEEELYARKHAGPPAWPAHVFRPHSVVAALRRGLAVDPRDRWPSMNALLDALTDDSSRRQPWLRSDPSSGVGTRALAVLPFRYQGPAEDAYLVDALADELIDLLAMTRGLRVSASGATRRYAKEHDARAVGQALGVDAIIDGTLHRRGGKVRIVARLVDVHSGFQSWSERFTGRLEDVFDLQDRMAKRVAEALRVELTLHQHGAVASAEAVEHYLRGRAITRSTNVTTTNLDEAIAHFEQARAMAPTFALPLAARAHATVYRWFVSPGVQGEPWSRAAAEAVQQALALASDLAETHLAAARFEVHRGGFPDAVRHLTKALEIAPTYAAAHEYLGILQCDAGRSTEGARHIRLAHDLDPTLGIGLLAVLRHHALRGHAQAYRALLERVRDHPSVPRVGVSLFEFRIALWHGNLEHARSIQWPSVPLTETVVAAFVAVLDDSLDHRAARRTLEQAVLSAANPRLRTVWRQISVELLAWRQALDDALEVLIEADAETVLLDADWLESCPLLAPLRARPEFVAIRERVRRRADQVWHLDSDGAQPAWAPSAET
ncbi:MAG: protein kinase [Myxococcota bacterium]